jgi:hypothetical protein
VNDDLMKAVRLHLERVLELPSEEQRGLLRRLVPLLVRLRFAIEAFFLTLSQRDSGTYQHQYTVPASA